MLDVIHPNWIFKLTYFMKLELSQWTSVPGSSVIVDNVTATKPVNSSVIGTIVILKLTWFLFHPCSCFDPVIGSGYRGV